MLQGHLKIVRNTKINIYGNDHKVGSLFNYPCHIGGLCRILSQVHPHCAPHFHLWTFCPGLYFSALQKEQFAAGVSEKEAWSLDWWGTFDSIFSFKRWYLKAFSTFFSLRLSAFPRLFFSH